jgi:hypothetical protein
VAVGQGLAEQPGRAGALNAVCRTGGSRTFRGAGDAATNGAVKDMRALSEHILMQPARQRILDFWPLAGFIEGVIDDLSFAPSCRLHS